MFRRLHLVVILAAFVLPVWVHAAVECSELFTPATAPSDHPTVEIFGRTHTAGGEEFFRLRKINETDGWRSSYAPREFDPQGDPRWVFSSLGAELSEVLGFSRIGLSEIRIPTPETLSRRIETFNIYLQDRGIKPIRFRFHWQPKTLFRAFLSNWTKPNPEVPFAMTLNHHTVHDISYHASGVMLTDSLVELLRIHAFLATQWLEFHPTDITHSFSMDVTTWIDNASTIANQAEDQPYVADSVHLAIAHLTTAPPSRKNETPLRIFIARLRYHEVQETFVHGKPADGNFDTAVSAFQARMQAQTGDWNKTLTELGVESSSTIAQGLNARSAELRAAAKDYLRLKNRM